MDAPPPPTHIYATDIAPVQYSSLETGLRFDPSNPPPPPRRIPVFTILTALVFCIVFAIQVSINHTYPPSPIDTKYNLQPHSFLEIRPSVSIAMGGIAPFCLRTTALNYEGMHFPAPIIVDTISHVAPPVNISVAEGCGSTFMLPTQVWRSLSFLFLHTSLLHLLSSVLLLTFLGGYLERRYGWERIAPLVLFTAYATMLRSLHLYSAVSVNVGATCTIYGLLGAVTFDVVFRWREHRSYRWFVLTIIVISSLIGLALDVFKVVPQGTTSGYNNGFYLALAIIPAHLPWKDVGRNKLYRLGAIAIVLLLALNGLLLFYVEPLDVTEYSATKPM